MLRVVSVLSLFLAAVSANEGGIVGGEEAEPHSIPFQVSLRQVDADDWHFCGGSVLGPRHILTAAHCTVIWDSVEEVEVVVGEHDRSVDEGTEQRVKVTKMTVHESYGSPKNYENDIAIWEVAEDIVMNDFVAAVALPELRQESTGSCTVSGWGTLKSGGSCCPMKLMKVDVPVVDESTCKTEYPFSIAESMICAGEHGKDSCQGDSGGPMLCYNEDGSGYLGGVETINFMIVSADYRLGVVSWGIGCGGYFHPGVYTEVSFFVDWIAANMA